MPTVNIHAAKTHLSQLLKQAQAGEEVIIAQAGVPIARLVPIVAPGQTRTSGGLEGLVFDDAAFFAPLPDDELRLWDGAQEIEPIGAQK